jgi:hypothetical protein
MIEERKRTRNSKTAMIVKGGILYWSKRSETCGSTLHQQEHQCSRLHVVYLNRK